MKTAVSIPKEIFEAADRLAKSRKTSRSHLYAEALREYLARHDSDAITEALNRVADAVDTSLDAFGREVARRTLKRNPW